MAELTLRAAAAGDVPMIGAIAIAAGQEEDWSGRNPVYVQHLMRHARLLVAASGGQLIVWPFLEQQITTGAAGDEVTSGVRASGQPRPRHRPRPAADGNLGDADGPSAVCSAHVRRCCTSFGLIVRLVLPYPKHQPGGRPLLGTGCRARPVATGTRLTGASTGGFDHRLTAGGACWWPVDARPVARKTARRAIRRDYGLMHLAISPAADDEAAAAAVICALAGLEAPGLVDHLLGPHPAVRLLACGWRVTFVTSASGVRARPAGPARQRSSPWPNSMGRMAGCSP